eukprot:COSAG01_NODE_8470_length_2774_cov_1.635888_3_plen_89_part_00
MQAAKKVLTAMCVVVVVSATCAAIAFFALCQADEAETDNGGLDSPSEGILACPIRVTLEDSAAVAVAATAAATFTVCENGWCKQEHPR